jgi:hypothetical protein
MMVLLAHNLHMGAQSSHYCPLQERVRCLK